MSSIADVLNTYLPYLGSVPPPRPYCVCEHCLGPVQDFRICYSCKRLFVDCGAPLELQRAVVPMTVADNPSPWYTCLVTYKKFQPGHMRGICALTYSYLRHHRSAVEAIAGGAIDAITTVPSKRGVLYDDQPLQRALALLTPADGRLMELVRFRPGATLGRNEYDSNAFDVLPAAHGRFVALIEDTWVTGATAVSAAGSLLEAGASGVVILPVARMVESQSEYWVAEHPYFQAMRELYDLTRFPR